MKNKRSARKITKVLIVILSPIIGYGIGLIMSLPFSPTIKLQKDLLSQYDALIANSGKAMVRKSTVLEASKVNQWMDSMAIDHPGGLSDPCLWWIMKDCMIEK